MFTFPLLVPDAEPESSEAPPISGIRICSPSSSCFAKLREVLSALSVKPPAFSTASHTLASKSNLYTPGFFTSPATCTVISLTSS